MYRAKPDRPLFVKKSTGFLAALTLCLPMVAHAIPYNIYDTRADFESAFGSGLNTYTVSPIGGNSLSLGSSGMIGPITFTNSDAGETYIVNDGQYGAGVPYLSNDGTTPIATGSGTFYAIGFELGEQYDSTTEISFVLNGFNSRTINVSEVPDTSFFGIISYVPITSVTFSGTDGELDVLSVETDATSPVPEPSSFALLGTGILGVGGMIRRRFVRS
jgi:hypothetical protein